MIDLHTHVLPGLDDGAETMDIALQMCRQAIKDGTRAVVATPHMFNGQSEVSRNDIVDGVDALRAKLDENGLDLEVLPGAEIHATANLCKHIDEGKVMTLGDGGGYILLELPSHVIPRALDHYLFSIRLAGITPILAHPERNYEILTRPGLLESLVSSGALLQITGGSLLGSFGRRTQKCAMTIMKKGMAHLVASDAHSAAGRTANLGDAYNLIKQHQGQIEADEVFVHRPSAILEGENILVPDIRRKGRMGFFKKLGMRVAGKKVQDFMT